MMNELVVGDGIFFHGLGEYFQVFNQVSSHHLSCHGIHLGQSHCFTFPVLVDQEGKRFNDDCSYDEYGHMGIQSGLSLLLEKGEELLPEEGVRFWMYIYFY